ncbi:hypothetical protein TSOC_006179 [Tetrabaena socialis]|uniref:Uncharacterized protein n=1 Tax=Tetrabaena socialis TaxID=47790 RepID=A0A2J8A4B6_9CHLO|nr:hypothetical protein TSOC_006179 [Tetrabaena socialis]|eukprot:PNH07348.1 hypothetical protein TSOC_006179 [Tetrabaena socialis]
MTAARPLTCGWPWQYSADDTATPTNQATSPNCEGVDSMGPMPPAEVTAQPMSASERPMRSGAE